MKRILPLLALLLCLASPAAAQMPDVVTADDSALVASHDDDDSAPSVDVLPDVTEAEAQAAVKTLLDHQKSGWGVVAAALLTLLVFLARKLKLLAKVPKKALPWVAAGVAMLGDVVAAFATGAALPDALLQGLMLGAAAVGFWEMAMKHVLTAPAEPEKS